MVVEQGLGDRGEDPNKHTNKIKQNKTKQTIYKQLQKEG
jgi:hypothetical protein